MSRPTDTHVPPPRRPADPRLTAVVRQLPPADRKRIAQILGKMAARRGRTEPGGRHEHR
jgi:hypothetical protein